MGKGPYPRLASDDSNGVPATPHCLQTKPYVEPVKLSGVEAVLVQCEGRERLLVRVERTKALPIASSRPSARRLAAAGLKPLEAAAVQQPAPNSSHSRNSGSGGSGSKGPAGAGDGARSAAAPAAAAAPRKGGSKGTNSSAATAGAAGTAGTAGAAGPEEQPLNVLVLFFDSVSRRHFFRRLPRSVAALEELAHGPGAPTELYQFFR